MEGEINRYQQALDQAGSKLDFVFGINLYMALSNMTLNIARQIVEYNNEILVATDDLSMGKNENINTTIIPQDVNIGEKGVFTLQSQDKPTTIKPATPATLTPAASATVQERDDNKSTLILVGLLIGGSVLMMMSY